MFCVEYWRYYATVALKCHCVDAVISLIFSPIVESVGGCKSHLQHFIRFACASTRATPNAFCFYFLRINPSFIYSV